jgi:uncharacterized spore protein YtfJ
MPWFRRPLFKWVLNTRVLRQRSYPVAHGTPDIVDRIVQTFDLEKKEFEKSFPEKEQIEYKTLSPITYIACKNRKTKLVHFTSEEAISRNLQELVK